MFRILQYCHMWPSILHINLLKSHSHTYKRLWKAHSVKTQHHCSSKGKVHPSVISLGQRLCPQEWFCSGMEPFVVIVSWCNHTQHIILTKLTAMLIATGYWVLWTFSRFITPLSSLPEYTEETEGMLPVGRFPSGEGYTKHQKLLDLVLNCKPDGYFIAKTWQLI